MDQCVAGSGADSNGWAMLNKTGSPNNSGPTLFQGEVHLVQGGANQSYTILLGDSSDHCMMEGMLTTNGEGIGNGHIPVGANNDTISSGAWHVVLQQGSNEVFASGPMTVS